ncbi:hypothetical protein C0Q70_03527 [Pomacea canaliculata]|uniref:Uncharacterized protein n=1 Tax=Pomacea canaliculata TaxID=400727 RepID=A0A2T7PSY7_POMCA|nr:hypothetical protein C0Q70_03527 [Pomacea canaliculata]
METQQRLAPTSGLVNDLLRCAEVECWLTLDTFFSNTLTSVYVHSLFFRSERILKALSDVNYFVLIVK